MKQGLAAMMFSLGCLSTPNALAQAPDKWVELVREGDIVARYDPTIDDTAEYPFNSSYEVWVDFTARPIRGKAPEIIAYLSVLCEDNSVERLAVSAYDAEGEFLKELSEDLVGKHDLFLGANMPSGMSAALFEKVCNKKITDY